MAQNLFKRQRLGGAWFFVAPALLYGIFTSRLPAIKAGAGLDDSQVGALLLLLGLSTLAGLLGSGFAIARFGAVRIATLAVFWFSAAMTAGVFFNNYAALLVFCALAGFGVSFCDVGMNAIGIEIEKCHNKYCLSWLHGCSCIGGVAGSLGSSLFAWLGFSPFFNFLLFMGALLLLWPATAGIKIPAAAERRQDGLRGWRQIGFFVCFCGFISLLCHVAEGSAGEWGSLFLHSAKQASQQEAALVFAFFTGAMLVCRFRVDRIRDSVSDFRIVLAGSLAGAAGMSLVLVSPWPALCLCGYAIMGAGLAPVAPIAFSRAGADTKITPGQASAVVSVFSYAGMLVIPPFLGIFSKRHGLGDMLWIIVAVCVALAFCAIMLRKEAAKG